MSEVIHTIDLIRHARSAMNGLQEDPNIVPFIGGRQNHVPLDATGEIQAVHLGFALRDEGYRPDTVLSSPAVRTLRTCELSTVALLGAKQEPIVDDRLQELTQGKWENQPRSIYDDPEVKAEMDRLGLDFAAPGGESMNTVADRMLESLGKLAVQLDNYDTPQHALVFSHGVGIKTAIGRLLGWSHQQTYKARINNVSRTRLEVRGGRLTVASINEQLIGKS